MPASSEFVAHNRTIDEIAKAIGADGLIYQDLEDLIDAVHQGNKKLTEFDCSCFNGSYIVGKVDEAYLTALEGRRNDSAKAKAEDDANDDDSELLSDTA